MLPGLSSIVSPTAIAGLSSLVLYNMLSADHDLTLWISSFCYPSWRLKNFFSGKVLWITGASSGLGRALAIELAQFGCKLVLSSRRVEELKKVKVECEINGAEFEDVLVLPLDTLNTEDFPSAVKKVLDRFQKIDHLVLNAGRSQRALAEDTDIAVDRAMMEVNFFSYIAHAKAVLPHMIERKSGCVTVMSSLTGKMGAPVSTAYSASKHALMGYFSSLRRELYSYGIDVLIVCPGPVRSNISLHSFTENIDKEYSHEVQDKGRKMEAHRFAKLLSVAIAARLPETWISIQPYLLFTYLSQYFPSIFNSALVSFLSQGRIEKFKRNECLY